MAASCVQTYLSCNQLGVVDFSGQLLVQGDQYPQGLSWGPPLSAQARSTNFHTVTDTDWRTLFDFYSYFYFVSSRNTNQFRMPGSGIGIKTQQRYKVQTWIESVTEID